MQEINFEGKDGIFVTLEERDSNTRFTRTMLCLRLVEFVCLIIMATAVFSLSSKINDDRRDVNKDGEVNITDLSVLAAEIQSI